ncbi:MAG: ATP-binding protein [Acholeplasmatales bacterium]|nr:ATP-binding protein [Acholeplasmatales bacterium]
MLKLLKLKVNGYKLLDDHFELDLVSKARVYQEDKEKEMLEVDKGLYTFRSMAFVGGNSSGKSTVLSILLKVLLFLQTGRWEYIPREFNKNEITIETIFYLDEHIYNYSFVVGKIDNEKMSSANRYSPILNEKLTKLKYDKLRGLKNLDLIREKGDDVSGLFISSLNDTSAITKITNNNVSVDEFNNNNISNFNETIVRNTFFTSLNSCDRKLVSSIIKLLDDSIECIKYDNSDFVHFKRVDEEEKIIHTRELLAILSAGTFRGVELFIRCINALKVGKVFIVDEIENCFQKNLVYNLLFLFNDDKINSNGAQLIFSTHYVEILDYLKRRDGIFITHKNNGCITTNNLYSDYNVRTELSKSKQFDNNVFNTSLNYKQVLEVRRNLIDELHINND